jgi:hypothetical protein
MTPDWVSFLSKSDRWSQRAKLDESGVIWGEEQPPKQLY